MSRLRFPGERQDRAWRKLRGPRGLERIVRLVADLHRGDPADPRFGGLPLTAEKRGGFWCLYFDPRRQIIVRTRGRSRRFEAWLWEPGYGRFRGVKRHPKVHRPRNHLLPGEPRYYDEFMVGMCPIRYLPLQPDHLAYYIAQYL